jgi:hypothetical protein
VVRQVLAEHDLRERLLKPGLGEPLQMTIGPRLSRPRPDQPAAQQELADPVPGAHQIAAQILTRPHQITQRLELGRGDQHRPKLAGRVKPCELQRVTHICFDPVTGLTRDRARRANHHLNTSRTRRTRQRKSRGPRLIDRAHLPGKRPKPLNRRRRGSRQLRLPHLTRPQHHRGRGRLPNVHIKPSETDTVRHVDAPFPSMR